MLAIQRRALAFSLLAAILAINVPSAFANFRTGTISWDRVPAADTATTYRVEVRVELAFRWSYPFGGNPSNCGLFPTLPPVTQLTGNGACAPIGTQLDLGSLDFSGGLAPASVVATVNAINITADTLYATAIIPVTFAKSANPLAVSYQQNSRIAVLLEGNGGQPLRLESLIDVTQGMRSPRSTAVPFIRVVTGVANDVLLSSVAFDNLQNRWDFSTPAQSQLVAAIPSGMTLDQGQAGLVHFTPPADGAYGVQFRVTSYDTAGNPKNSVPLDTIFLAEAVPAGVVSITTPDTALAATINSPLQFQVQTTLSNWSAGYAGDISNTPLPTGASVSATSCNASEVCSTTFSWTPNANSTSSLVCFQGAYTNLTSTFTSPQLCVQITMPAQATTMVASPATGAAGGPVAFAATLTRTSDGAPIVDRDVTFRYQDTGELIGTARTSVAGTATLTSIVMQPTTRIYAATFDAVANEFLPSSGSASLVVAKTASGVLTNISLVGNPSLGFPLQISAQLTRVHPDGVTTPGPQTLSYQVSGPSYSVSGNVTADASGLALFSVVLPLNPATFTVTVTFVGSTNLLPAPSQVQLSFTSRQRIQITVNAPSPALAGVNTTATATLIKIPQNTPIASRGVTVTSSLPLTTGLLAGVTSASGVRTLSGINFGTRGTATLTFSASLASGEADSDGFAATETGSAQVTVIGQATQLTISPATATIGQSKTLTAVLKATPSGLAIVNAPVTFSIVGGATLGTTNTNSAGTASLAFTPSETFSGAYQVDYAGSATNEASTAQAALTVNKAATSIGPFDLNSDLFVGDTLNASTGLVRTDTPPELLSGATVTFTLTGDASNPGGATSSTLEAISDQGNVGVLFPLTARGRYTITASYAGSGSLQPASTSASFTVFQKTHLVMSDAHGVASDPLTINASLLAIPGNAPIAGQTIEFSFQGVVAGGNGTTINGIASLSRVFATPGSYPVTASFSNPGDYFRDENGNAVPAVAIASVMADAVTTALSSLSVAPVAFVGSASSAHTTLTRVSAPAGPLGGRPVSFVVSPPSGSPAITEASTDADGLATATLSALTERGPHTISATFAGTAALIGATVSTTQNVYQRTQLSMPSSVSAVAGTAISLSATLKTFPLGTVIPLQGVTFSFGGAMPDITVDTNAAGVATASVVFSNSGTFSVTAVFSNSSAYFADETGAFPIIAETTAGSVVVSAAATSLSGLTVPGTSLVGSPMTVSAVLTRTSAPAGPAVGETVTFTVTEPGGSTTSLSGSAITTAGGLVSYTFTPTTRGVHAITATFAAGPALEGSTSGAVSVNVYQRVQLVVSPPVNPVAGQSTPVSATVVALPSKAPVAGNQVTFSTSVAGIGPTTVLVDANGVASTSFTFPSATTVSVTGTFVGGPGEFFADRNGQLVPDVDLSSAAAVPVAPPVAALAAPSLPASGLVGSSMTVTTKLSAVGGTGLSGRSISFLVTAPDGSPLTLNAITQNDGSASAAFAPSQRGISSVIAQFAGDSAFLPVSTSAASVTVYQRASLSVTGGTSIAGSPMAITATLAGIPGDTLLAGQVVSFSFGGVIPVQQATTDAAGEATVTVVFAQSGSVNVVASFLNVAGYFADQSGALAAATATSTVTVTATATALSAVAAPANVVAGHAATVSTTLNRVDAGIIGPGHTIVFTITAPGGGTSQVSAPTGANGLAAATFTPTLRGVHTVSAAFAGADALLASTAGSASVAVYQPASLTMPATTAAAGSTITLSATLAVTGAPLAGQSVDFTFSGTNAPPSQFGVITDVNGVATITVVPASAGSFTANASFFNTGGYFVNHAGALPPTVEVASAPFVIAIAPATLSLSAPSGSIGAPITATAALARTDGLSIPSGQPIAFTLTAAGGATTVVTSLTNAAGVATITLTPARGAYTLAASFAGSSAVVPASASTPFSVYQRTALALPVSFTVQATKSLVISATLTQAPGGAPIGGATITFAFAGPGAAPASQSATTNVSGVATASVTFPTNGNYTVTATFANGAGFFTNTAGAIPPAATLASGTVTVTVLNNPPSFVPPVNISVEATGPNGAAVTFIAKGTDLQDGTINAVCSKPSGATFPIAVTTVTCTVTDSGGLTASGSFTVTVSEVTTPGDMRGDGYVRDDDAKYMFEFRARENARGDERASIKIRIDEDGRRRNNRHRDDRFESRTVDFIAFSDDPTIRPGRPRRAQIDTVLFTGIGEWNGRRNYRYEAFAQDAGEPGRHRESIRVKIFSPSGALVATFEGDLDGGNIQSVRIRH